MKRVPVVPWSTAAAYFLSAMPVLLLRGCRLCLLLWNRSQAVAQGSQHQVGGCRARVLVADAAIAEVAGSSLQRFERNRRLHAFLGRVCRRGQRLFQGRSVIERLLRLLDRGS